MSYTAGAGAESYGAGIFILTPLALALALTLVLALMAEEKAGVDLSACRSDLSLLPTECVMSPHPGCVVSCHADGLMSYHFFMSSPSMKYHAINVPS